MSHRDGESASDSSNEHTVPSTKEVGANARSGAPCWWLSDGDDHPDLRSSAAGPPRPSPAGPARLLDPLPDLHHPAHDLAGRVLANTLWTAGWARAGTVPRHKILIFDAADGF